MSIVFDFADIAARMNRRKRIEVQAWSDDQKREWLEARNWEEICHQPNGSFRGVHAGVRCFEVNDASASKPQA